MRRAYLAGPDVFFPEAGKLAARKQALCAAHEIEGVHPFCEETRAAAALPAGEAWRAIYRLDIGMLESCDIVIANLTPFRGVSADAGTLVELGMAAARGMTIFAYTNEPAPLAARVAADGNAIENFGLADNLMILGAIAASGGALFAPAPGAVLAADDLSVFAEAVAAAERGA